MRRLAGGYFGLLLLASGCSSSSSKSIPPDASSVGGSGGTTAGGTTIPASSSGGTTTGGTTIPARSSGGATTGGSTATPVTTPTSPNADLTATVHVDRVTYVLAPEFSGQNYESFSGWGADVSLSDFQKAAFKAAGLQMLRYPGGAPADWFDLAYTGKCSDGSAANWGAPAYGSLWTAFSSGGLKALMLQTNPTAQWCGTGAQDASGTHVAAIATTAAANGIPVIFEIGNEPDIGDSFFAAGGADAYTAKFIEHAKAIHGAVSTAKVYGPAVCGLGANCSFPVTWDSKWIGNFLAKTGNKATGDGKGTIDGVSFHVYLHSEWGYSDLTEAKTDLYGFAQYWPDTLMPYLRQLIAQYDDRDLPVAISEVSIGAASDSNGNGSMSAVLRTIDLIAAFAASGVHSFQWFDANAAGPSDFWMITASAVRPCFYAFEGWAQMGNQVLGLDNSANPHDVSMYGTSKADGSVQVLVVNKTNSAHAVSFAFSGFDANGKSMAVTTANSSDGTDSTGAVVFNGAKNPAPAGISTPVASVAGAKPQISVPAYSFAVVSFAK
jgi:hypothetical protein